MARAANRLTAVAVRYAKPGMHGDGGGLYLRVGNTGARSWIYRYKAAGRAHDVGLGSLTAVSLAQAREKAAAFRMARAGGIDPIEHRRTERTAGKKFRQAAAAYIAGQQPGWRSAKHAADWANSLAMHVYPIIGDMPVAGIDTAAVLRVLAPIWATIPETASRVRGRIEAVLDAAVVQGLRPRGENPARWRGHLAHTLPARRRLAPVKHHDAMAYTELPALMAELRGRDSTASRALQFVILTAARTGEVLGARWAEIDLDAKVWTIPPERMKAGREHRVPLSDAAIALIEQMATIRQGECVFVGASRGRPIGPNSLRLAMKATGRPSTVHGLRSAFRDWCADGGVASEIAEMALAHQVGSAVERAYRRSDLFAQRRELMARWAEHCADAAGRVMRLQAAR